MLKIEKEAVRLSKNPSSLRVETRNNSYAQYLVNLLQILLSYGVSVPQSL